MERSFGIYSNYSVRDLRLITYFHIFTGKLCGKDREGKQGLYQDSKSI